MKGLLLATTVQKYALPGVRPPTTIGLALPIFVLPTPPFDERQVAL